MNVQSDEDPNHEMKNWWQRHHDSLGVAACSIGIHIALLAIMAMIVLPSQPYDLTKYMTIRTEVATNAPLETVDNIDVTPEKLNDRDINDSASLSIPTNVVAEQPSLTTVDTEQQELRWQLDAIEYLGKNNKSGELSGRTEEARSILTKAFGGTATSEAAVSNGLKWLANHQNKDGSWNFNHTREACKDSCTSPGSLNNKVGATSMAMLCFVGAGHTHQDGNYQEQVRNGLEFLARQYLAAETKGDMRGVTGGNSGMYAHGIATIVLCELYGLSRDRKVRTIAQACVDFTVDSQHAENGGWRYRPNQADGDTSVVGWQIMAVTSAKMAGLTVPGRVKVRAERFLNSVQLEQGAYYGYTTPSKKASTTSIGLLCRMYYGWDSSTPALGVGVDFLSTTGPSKDNQYYNYYATQVLHHWGGSKWKKWNKVMRPQLVSTQVADGHAAGSWAPRDPHGRTGGRLYSTCLSILTLEVYYRHLPLYQRQLFKKEI